MENIDATKYSPCPCIGNRRNAGITQRRDVQSFGDMIHFEKEIAQLKIGTLGPFKHTSKVTRTQCF